MALPSLSNEQRVAALELAGAARKERAEFKRKLASGELKAVEGFDAVVGGDSKTLRKLRVNDFLKALPGIGKSKAAAIMEESGIAPSRRLSGLGQRQVSAIRQVCEKVDQRA